MTEAAKRILIVEDQKLIAADLENTLRRLGYDVVGAASSGEDAITKTEELRPNVVLMDVRLRGPMDGIQAAAAIRDRLDVPILYLTAYADEQTILRAKVTTPFGYLVKPFNERELRAAIEVALYKHETDHLLADERARRQASEEFKLLIESVKDYAIFLLDVDGRVISWNAGAERIKGYRYDEIVGQHFSRFYPPEVAATGKPQRALEKAAREGRVVDEDWRIRKDGSRFWASVVITAHRDKDGRLRGFAKVTRDMTERKEIEEAQRQAREEAERANRLKDEFLATVSHELRTPLSVMQGEIWRLQTGRLGSASTDRALDLLERNAKLQTRLVEDLLDTSAIITGKLKMDARAVELAPVLEAALDTVRPAVTAKNIELCVELSPAAGPICGDAGRLQQIFWNLLSNAVKFTPAGGRIELRLERAGTNVQVEVTDSGVGIPTEFLPRVFDRFSQADSTSTRIFSGFGLGLALSRYLVEAHGGELMAHSEGPDRGSTFTVRFPVPAVVPSKVPIASDIQLAGIQVLLVDDQPDARESVGAILRMFGAEVVAVGSTADAIAALDHVRPNVLLADIAMPDEDGYELIRKIRTAAEPELRTLAAAALTAYSSTEDRLRVLSAGYHLYVPKPTDPAELATAISRLAKGVSDAARGAADQR